MIPCDAKADTHWRRAAADGAAGLGGLEGLLRAVLGTLRVRMSAPAEREFAWFPQGLVYVVDVFAPVITSKCRMTGDQIVRGWRQSPRKV